MKPVLVIVGRPNVGKSTLFNRLTRSRDALVADLPGLTRDRHYGEGRMGDKPFIVVDTGGFEPDTRHGIFAAMAKQTELAIEEADTVVFLVDGRLGVHAQDQEIAARLRRSGRVVCLVVNKLEGMSNSGAPLAEFYGLGLGEPQAISSAHGDGVQDMLSVALAACPDLADEQVEAFDVSTLDDPITGKSKRPVRVAVAGRPNVGKSTLVNTLLGEERVIAFDQPGTTRDSISVDFSYANRPYTLIDTAGLRKRGKVFEAVEKFSVIKTLHSIEAANVVILLLDASQDIADQDAHIAGFIVESGRALVVAVNKWDAVDTDRREQVKRDLERKFRFLSFARFHYISAKNATGIGMVMRSVNEAYAAAMAKLSTPKLTRMLIAAVQEQPPPRKGIFRPKLRYAHQGGQNPPIVIIHGNALEAVPDTYRRYLESRFRRDFELHGTPLRIEFRTSKNPYLQRTEAE